MADEPTAESILGSVVGSMMALRKGPNRHLKGVAREIIEQVDNLRALLQAKDSEIAELKGRHNPEVCVDTMEYCERLKSEVVEINATLVNYIHSLGDGDKSGIDRPVGRMIGLHRIAVKDLATRDRELGEVRSQRDIVVQRNENYHVENGNLRKQAACGYEHRAVFCSKCGWYPTIASATPAPEPNRYAGDMPHYYEPYVSSGSAFCHTCGAPEGAGNHLATSASTSAPEPEEEDTCE